MRRIRVDPDHLRELAHRFYETADALQALRSRLSVAWERLDVGGWEGEHRNQVEPQWWQAQTRLNVLSEQAAALSHFLNERAARFEEADRAGMAAVGQVAGAFAAARQAWDRWFRPLQYVLRFPHDLVGRLLRLGGWVVQAPVAFVASVGGLSTALLAGIRSLRPVPPQWRAPLDQAVRRLPSPPTPEPLPVSQLADLEGTSAQTPSTPMNVPPPLLKPADPTQYSSCVLYAQARRPDLGLAGGDGGAYNFIRKYRRTERYWRISPEAAQGDLRVTPLRPGTAVVWDRGVRGADKDFGHVAIIEEVGPDHIEVSEAGWGKSTRRRIPASHLPDLHFIL